MKKAILLLVSFIFVAFVFVGCGELNENLKLAQFTQNSIDIAFRYADNLDNASYQAINRMESEEYKNELRGYVSSLSMPKNEIIGICAAMDYFSEIENQEDADAYKLYEHNNNSQKPIGNVYSKYIVSVENDKRLNSVINTKIFLLSANSLASLNAMDYVYAVNNYQEVSSVQLQASFQFSVNLNRLTNKYILSYEKGSKCSAEYYFDSERGYITLNITAVNSQIADGPITTSLFIGGYKNNIIIGRTTVSYTSKSVGYKQEFVWEFLDDLIKLKSKIGLAKDTAKYLDLKSVLESDVAVSNAGDYTGFLIKITTTNLLDDNILVDLAKYINEAQ